MPAQSDQPAIDGPFVLAGPVARPDPARVPLRGDLAHIGLAGRYFVPHYAVPQPRAIAADTPLRSAPEAGADVLADLAAGTTFDVLEISGGWAWGCLSLEGPVGYVPLDTLA